MKPSARCLQSLGKKIQRQHTVGFIGLGQMGYAMATNWFMKRVAEPANAAESGFVVCDVDSVRAQSFADTFNATYPKANISVVSNPAE